MAGHLDHSDHSGHSGHDAQQHGHAHGHGHGGHSHSHGVAADADRRWLTSALVLIVAFMAVEVVIGYAAHSLALISDAAHMLTDAASIVLALVAMRLAARPPAAATPTGSSAPRSSPPRPTASPCWCSRSGWASNPSSGWSTRHPCTARWCW